jgi:formate dehydrogenase alpha subunit
MGKSAKSVHINIDNRALDVEPGLTILQAAERNGIYIPTLCAHQDLTPFGGCRLCIVKVDGIRGLTTACTTPVEEGMVVRTDTAQVQAERREILRLILSEHTSSCLICDERVECKEYMGTIRKSGVTTGCRYCPNDDQCELQDVVDYLDVKEIGYPVYYRGLLVEKKDPFYDRDYNLCILCGRCIRVCQEIRTASTLAFKQRGGHTVIGPAFDRSHLEAGCEFCGACVSVCPTGALAEKARKWEGKPEREEVTTCPLCGVGCQLRLLIKGGRIIGSLPAEDPLVNNGQLCVKGRFCVAGLVNHHRRLKKSHRAHNGTMVEISWDEAIESAAEKLSTCPPGQFGMLISPNCSNENLYAAQKFARVVMGSPNIDTSARLFYGPGLNAYLKLMRRSVPLTELGKASIILCLGLDTRFGRSVVGVELRKAAKRGAKIVTINPRQHNLGLIAEKWLQPAMGRELHVLRSLVRLTKKNKARSSRSRPKPTGGSLTEELLTVAQMLTEASTPVILMGSEFLQHDKNRQIFEAAEQLAHNLGAGVLPLPAQNNLLGSIIMGAYPEILPGGISSADKKRARQLEREWGAALPKWSSRWNAKALWRGRRLKVLYLIGERPPNCRHLADFVIYQNIYPLDGGKGIDLVLPSTAFAESEGTFINGEGRLQRARKVVDPPGEALPDWEILRRVATKMGVKGLDFSSPRQIHREISHLVEGFGNFNRPKRQAGPLLLEAQLMSARGRSPAGKTDKKFPLILCASAMEHAYRGFDLADWVEGSDRLFAPGIVDMNPKDAQRAKICTGDEIVVTSGHFERIWTARVVQEQAPGRLHVTLSSGESIGTNQIPVKVKKRHVSD